MNPWAKVPNPPPVVEEEVEDRDHQILLVHPIDFDRCREYVKKIFAAILAGVAADQPIDEAEQYRVVMKDIEDWYLGNLRPDQDVPTNFGRSPFGPTVQFVEQPLTEFFHGIEDRSKFNVDVRRFKERLCRQLA